MIRRMFRALPQPVQRGIVRMREFPRLAAVVVRALALWGRPKVVYLLTPPPYQPNLGDHAQVVAIRRWLARHYPGLPVLELDKDQTERLLPLLRLVTRADDPIVLQSGGNMGERGLWTERVRRAVIAAFPGNRILSLPQSIQFGDSEQGRAEAAKTSRVYGEHPHLSVVARDPVSLERARGLFPHARLFIAPDMVLALAEEARTVSAARQETRRVLCCLRRDDQARGPADETARRLGGLLQEAGWEHAVYDTEVRRWVRNADAATRAVFAHFRAHAGVVTDRFHGLVFAVACGVPCVVLPTVDHKLTAAMHWFEGIPWVRLAGSVEDVPGLFEQCRDALERGDQPDWNAFYFDPMAAWAAASEGDAPDRTAS